MLGRHHCSIKAPHVSSPSFNPYGPDTDINNPRYFALKQACKFGALSSVRSILESANSADLDLHQPEPLTQEHLQKCLFEAFVNNNFYTARYLIREAGVEMKPMERLLSLHASRNLMSIEAFEFLIQEGWDINGHVGQYRTALSYVLRSFLLTKWFLEHGANPNLGPDNRERNTRKASMVPNSGSVLGSAACTDPSTAVALIDLLMQYGARLEESIPLHLAASCPPYQNSDESITLSNNTYLQPQGGHEVNLTSTSFSSRIPVLQHLLDLGCNLNATDVGHWCPRPFGPPLHWAVYAESVENARFLLENGADPWARNPVGFNALEAAKRQNEDRNPTGKKLLARQYIDAAILENELPGQSGNPWARALEKINALEDAEIINEPPQESELEKLIKKFMLV